MEIPPQSTRKVNVNPDYDIIPETNLQPISIIKLPYIKVKQYISFYFVN